MKEIETIDTVNVHVGRMPSEETKKRDSNFELMRIIMMILIITHHYVVNSGITKLYDYSNITSNMIFLQCVGFSGKIMINCFILITGYFSVKGKFKFEKVIRLYLEIKFYTLIIYFIFIALGIDTFSIKGLIKTLFNLVYGVNINFFATFFLLYLLIPFINVILNKLHKKQYTILLGILLFYFTIISTFSISNDTFNEITWYIVVYMIGAYIQLYFNKCDKSKTAWLISTFICVLASITSIIGIDIFNYKFNTNLTPYYFVINAHKLFAVLTSISLFMLFRNINIRYSKFINTVASSTFGVLLIHANSYAMIKLVWQDIFNVKSQYYSNNLYIHTIFTVLTVYVVCVCIDLLRIKFLEKPLFKFLKSKNKFNKVCDKVDASFNM